MSLIKICGLSSQDGLVAALDGGADMIGLVHFEKSPRHVSLPQAQAIVRFIAGRARSVVLTVDASDAELDEIVATVKPDMLQLHGHETPERVAAIRQSHGLPVFKAVGIAGKKDLETARSYLGVADMLLLDAKPPATSALPGGNGVTFDWSLLDGFNQEATYMLSGGLTPENVGQAIRAVSPGGVDVSSGVELLPGIKDPAKIRSFITAARSAFDANDTFDEPTE